MLRFYYSHSHLYGWAVYDRQTNTPAWEGCADLLPPVAEYSDGSKTTVEPCVPMEYDAMRLCSTLNHLNRMANAKKGM